MRFTHGILSRGVRSAQVQVLRRNSAKAATPRGSCTSRQPISGAPGCYSASAAAFYLSPAMTCRHSLRGEYHKHGMGVMSRPSVIRSVYAPSARQRVTQTAHHRDRDVVTSHWALLCAGHWLEPLVAFSLPKPKQATNHKHV